MSKVCSICNERTIFFVWASSRNIKDTASKLIMKYSGRELDTMDSFCYKCCKEHNLLKERPPIDMNKPRKYKTWSDIKWRG